MKTTRVARWRVNYAQKWERDWVTLTTFANSYQVAEHVANALRRSPISRCVEIVGPEYVLVPA